MTPILYTFSQIKNPYLLDNDFFAQPSTNVPLDSQYKEIIKDDMDWQEFIWSNQALIVGEKKYEQLVNFKLYDIKANNAASK